MHGQTPLYISINYRHFKIAKILIDHGADIMAREKNRHDTPLHLATAAVNRNVDFIEFLTSRGADKEAKDIHGLTPLLRSAMIPNGEVAMTLIRLGCDTRAIPHSFPDEKPFDFLKLIIQTSNFHVLRKLVHLCPKTKKPKLNPSLKALPRESKEDALNLWSQAPQPSSKT